MRKIRIAVEYDAIIEECEEGMLRNVNEICNLLHENLVDILPMTSEEYDLKLNVKINKYNVTVEEVSEK